MAAQPIATPVAAPAPRPAGVAGHHLRLERFEYGKPCIRPDGPIEAGSEHGELGRSPDFPAAVARWCDPSLLGVVSHSFESRPAGCEHGTTLRPVVSENRVIPVLARVRSRPEDGENGSGRSYTLARYLVSAAGELSPLALFAGMESAPLLGLTRAELGRGLPPLQLAPPPAPALTPATRSFLQQAVVFVLSGVPIGVVEPIEETLFFEWVTALWWLLPASLRPLLSAGWGVGRSLSGALAVTYAAEPADNVAIFSTVEGTWTPPPRVLLEKTGRWDAVPFQDRRLVPGRMYAFAAFPWRDGVPEVASLSVLPAATCWSRGLPAFGLPEQPDFRDPMTVRAFRWPGLQAVDSYRVAQLREWLEAGDAGEAKPPEALAAAFIYPDSEVAAVEATIAALAQPGRRNRAELALRRFLGRSLTAQAKDWLLAANRPGAARARLIACAESTSGAPVVACLREAAAAGEAEGLPDELAARLTLSLDESLQSLDAGSAELHTQMLRAPWAPQLYREWARRNACSLAFALVRWRPPGREGALEALRELDPSSGLESLVRWATGAAPREEDVPAVAGLTQKHRQLLATCLSEDWERPGPGAAARRELVLQWARAQVPEPATHSLLRFALGAGDLQAGDVRNVAGEVEAGTAPLSLAPRLAGLALREWDALGGRIRQYASAWSTVVAHWPWEAARLLVDNGGEAMPAADPSIVQLARDLRLAGEEVQALIERWLPRLAAGTPEARAIADYLWNWAIHSRPSQTAGLVALCAGLEEGRLPPNARPAEAEVDTVIRLAAESGAAARLAARAEELWSGAAAFWSIRLVLETFPEVDLNSSAQQLELLVRQRTWIAGHLGSTRIHAQRREGFRVAQLRFHQARYPDDGAQWRDDLATTVVWAAFRGVPLAQQGSLAAALEVYAAGAEEQARHCLTYLEAAALDARDETVLRVLSEAVVPTLRGRGLADAKIRELFERLRDQDNPPPRTRRARIRGFLRRWWARLAPPIRVEIASTPLPAGLAVHGRRLVVARWHYDYLRTLVRCGAVPLLPRALGGRFGGTEI